MSERVQHVVRRSAAWQPGRWGATAAIVVAVILAVPSVASASVSAVPDTTAGVTGKVYAIARIGDRTIIGGDFTAVGGVARRNAAAIRANGTVDLRFKPNPNGIVRAIAVSADATRVFLGGSFTKAGGAPRARLAAVNATNGGVIPTWWAGANDDVDALATAGNLLYVGGKFTTIGGITRRRLAAVDTTTHAVQLAFNPWADWTVRAIVVSPDRTKVYAAGGFKTIGGAARMGAAELQAGTGAATAFAPSRGGAAVAIGLTPNGSYLFFSTERNKLFAYRPAVSNLPRYKWLLDGDVQAIAASATEVYLGGHFAKVWRGTTPFTVRSGIASLSVAGALTTWNPGANGGLGVWSTVLTPTRLVVGGEFLTIGATSQPGFARFTGTP